jgi:NAD(P)-dependent dehydrogenase (short-subunit alcohol dehydrogenase family)
MRLTNKTALTTGGNSGIGLATARLFVAEGAGIAITGRSQKTLRAAAAELGDGVAQKNIQSIGLLKLDAEFADWEILNA